MNKNIPSGIAVMMVVVVLALIGYLERNAFAGKKEPPPQKVDTAYCIRCHSDAKTLAAMKRKEGNTHFAFHGNMTVRSLIGKSPADVDSAASYAHPLPPDWK